MATSIYKTSDNQTVMDVCLIIYNSYDYLSQLIFDNNLSLDKELPAGTLLKYDSTFTPNSVRITTGMDLFPELPPPFVKDLEVRVLLAPRMLDSLTTGATYSPSVKYDYFLNAGPGFEVFTYLTTTFPGEPNRITTCQFLDYFGPKSTLVEIDDAIPLPQYDMKVQYKYFPSDLSDDWLLYFDEGRPLRWRDSRGNIAGVSPLMLLGTTSQQLVNLPPIPGLSGYYFFCPDITIDFISSTTTTCDIKITKDDSKSLLFFDSVAVDWTDDAIFCTPDGIDPNIGYMTLPKGKYKLGVQSKYETFGVGRFPATIFQMIIEIY